ncbi:MAG: CcmD family protein [Desulfovibrio sp.]|nr:CcmD family protein [Desulfovibrio sp.]
MGPEFYIALAGAAIWAGFGVFLAILALGQKRLSRKLERLENLSHEK